MVIAVTGASQLDYMPCRYGQSKLVFRGPKKNINQDYIAVIGGTEAYGRFVAHPFPDLIEEALDMPVLNLACPNAGIDAFLYDADVLSLAKGARLTVVQVIGAQNMSNRFYRVHPRRNDRFLGPSDALKAIFREVDFTEFSFVRHMLSTLQMVSAEKFGLLRDELAEAWIARMKLLLQAINGPVALLWLREAPSNTLGREPLFVGADMVEEVAPMAAALIEIDVHRAGEARDGMVCGPMEGPVAAQMLGVPMHRKIAAHVSDRLPAFLK